MRYLRFILDGKKQTGVRDGDKIRVLGDTPVEALLASGVDLETWANSIAGGALEGTPQKAALIDVIDFCISRVN